MLSRFHSQLLIITISLGVFASVMSTSMLVIAFPDVVRDFGISEATLQWRNLLFYSLFAVGLPFFGILADRFGARKQFLFGMVLFCLAAMMSGLVQNWTGWLFFQSLQAVADSMIVAAQSPLIRASFPKEKLGWAFGWFAAVISTATLTGPALGGLVIEYLHWSAIFWVLGAFGLLALMLAVAFLPKSSEQPADGPQACDGQKVDAGQSAGAARRIPWLSLLSMFAFVLGGSVLLLGTVDAMGQWIVGLLTLLALLGLLWKERRPGSSATLFPREMAKNGVFMTAAVRVFLLFLGVNAIGLYAPTYLRIDHGFPADTVGWIMLTQSLVALVAAGYAGKMADRRPYVSLAAGIGVSVGSSWLFWFADVVFYIPYFYLIFFLIGLGNRLTMPAQNKIALLAVPPAETGSYMGVFQMIQFVTGAFAATLFAGMSFQMLVGIIILCQLAALATVFMKKA
ncbi:hypothetical protein CBW65_10460 [Tumebacillus avium]|uniref:Major facilitator superfamily (MFS) profile domain-containing protein n=1 Tax=Tumebacillus avium TaxID=1903704 RepID=A0A1Y0IPF8_9BACL|nr:MFS transporter [Tumebacillus avium]ARU61375.1 hypothetical protein CBW65_10460 [Tumebacillus avium]